MQFTTEINTEKRLVHIRATGRVAPHIFREALMNTFWSDRFEPTYDQIIDLTDIESSPVIDDAEDVHKVFRAMKKILKGKIAVVAPTVTVHAMVIVVAMLAAKEGLHLEVFKDVDKAKEWLGVE